MVDIKKGKKKIYVCNINMTHIILWYAYYERNHMYNVHHCNAILYLCSKDKTQRHTKQKLCTVTQTMIICMHK
jgi:hypothetical protein